MAVFSCEAHNDKGLTVSRGVQVNVKGERRAGPRTSGGWGGGMVQALQPAALLELKRSHRQPHDLEQVPYLSGCSVPLCKMGVTTDLPVLEA